MGEMSKLGPEGDTKIIWDSTKPAEVAAAKASFDALRGKGYAAFRVNRAGDQTGDQIREFDADAEKIILVPQIQGGRRG